MDSLDAFVARLAATPAPRDAVNPYAGTRAAGHRANLRRFLGEVRERGAKVALVGEAPGYRGCPHTGISFTSERILLAGVPGLGLFGPGSGYVFEGNPAKPWGEPSSTIVWGALGEVGIVPLIWSAYPFHPHTPGVPLSNRAPRRDEIELGRPLLEALLGIFQPSIILAVGNIASATLTNLGVAHDKVRHPAHGGATMFRQGVRNYVR